MKPKMLFFDVDGTLLDNHKNIVPPSTINVLQELSKNGYHIAIATGRSYRSLCELRITDIVHWDMYVCNNGQTILDPNGIIVEEHFIPPSTVRKCIAVGEQYSIPLTIKQMRKMITRTPNQYVKEASAFFNLPIAPIRTYVGDPVSAIIAYGPIDYDYAPFLTIPHIKVTPGVSTYADITIEHISKYTGIKKNLEKFQQTKYVAFGDSNNDIEMLQGASIAVAMGQSTPEIQNIADLVTSSVDANGIQQALQKLGYIKE